MRLLGLYVMTLVVYFISVVFLVYLTDKAIFSNREDEELPNLSSDAKYYIFLLFLYTAGIISYAVLPALGKGEFLTVVVSGFIYALTANAGSYLFNFNYVKFMGIKQCLTSISVSVIATLITASTSYYLALLVLE